jgi:hypothetical protein
MRDGVIRRQSHPRWFRAAILHGPPNERLHRHLERMLAAAITHAFLWPFAWDFARDDLAETCLMLWSQSAYCFVRLRS